MRQMAVLTPSEWRMNVKNEACLKPGCKRKVKSRGLCLACYKAAAKLIKAGGTTWEKLEKAGRSAILQRKSTVNWLLHGKE